MKPQTIELPKHIRKYLAEQQLCCKRSTIGTYRVALRPFCNFLRSELNSGTITKSEIARITHDTMQKYLYVLCEKPLAAYSRVNYLLAIRKYLDWEVAQGTICPDILDGFDRHAVPKVPEYLPKPLSVENDRLLMQRCADSPHRYAPMFRLLRLTGLRISELINLPRDCILRTADDAPFLKVPLGKMNNERLVPLHNEALDLIKIIKDQSIHANANSGRLIGIDGTIPSVYGRMRTQFQKITRDIVDQGKPITFHRLRHTYATSLLSAGVGILTIMKLLGHRRIEMSMRYTKVVPSHLRDEYLKAIDVLKNNWAPPGNDSLDTRYACMNTSELINLLRASIKMKDDLDTQIQRNLIKRVDRLKADLKTASLNRHISPNNQSASRLAG